VGSTVIWRCTGDRAGGDYGFSQVVIYMSVYACQCELDSGNGALVPASEQNLPAGASRLAGERGFEGREVEMRELYVELSKPCGISEPTTCDPCFDRLRNLQIEPVEPFQPIPVHTSAVDAPESLENVRNRMGSGLNSSEERSVVGKHGPIVIHRLFAYLFIKRWKRRLPLLDRGCLVHRNRWRQ
jgi:hypothetical protein